MKKTVIAFAFLILLTSLIVVSAQATDSTTNQTSFNINTTKDVLTNATQGLGNKLNNKTQDILETEVNLPDWLAPIAKVVFGIDGSISWQKLIIVLGIWVMVFIIILSVLGLAPFFDKIVVKLLASIVITALISLTGGAVHIANFFLSIGDLIKINSAWDFIKVFGFVLLCLVVAFFVNLLTEKMRKRSLVEIAEKKGIEVNEAMHKIKEEAKNS